MNQDETNSNSKPDMRTWIEPELEARVVAWVAGEASAFEIAELERIMAEKPELAVFKRRIEAVQGLVGEAVRPDQEPLRMSEERRAKLLATLGATHAVKDEKVVAMPAPKTASRYFWRSRQVYVALASVAAVLLIGLYIAPMQFVAYKRDVMPEMLQRVQDGEASKAAVEGVPARPRALEAVQENLRVRLNEPQAAQDRAPVPAAPPASEPVVQLDAFTVTSPKNQRAAKAPARVADPKTAETPARASEVARKEGMRFFRPPSSQPVDTSVGANWAQRPDTGFRDQATASSASNDALRKIAQTSDAATEIRAFGNDSRVGGAQADSLRLRESNAVVGGAGGQRDGQALADAAPFSSPMSPAKPDQGYVAGPPAAMTLGAPAEKPLSQPGAAGAGKITLGASSAGPVTFGSSAGIIGGAVSGSLSVPPGAAGEKQKAERQVAIAGEADHAAAAPVDRLARIDMDANKDLQDKKRDMPMPMPLALAAASATDETNAAKEAVSTFSLHVSDVSFRLAVAATAAMERGETPKTNAVRVEEFYNAFDYGDPAVAVNEKIGAWIEQSVHPVLQQRNLVRIALKVPSAGRAAGQSLRLTVLLDTSGSMERDDRRLAVRRALEELVALLGPNDRITLIGFARQPRLLAEAVAGNQAGHLVELAARTPAEGGTNLESALKLAGEMALRHRYEKSQNRIVLLTDGAANLGNADPEQLANAVESLRQQGVAFDACGIGLEGVGDAVLEALTRKGDGRYYVVDRPEAADAAFARQLAGAFRPAAENVKLQVRFNPARVGHYRLVGFEQHRLREEDFRNDAVDAAELAAEEGANALYQVEVLPQGTGEIGEVFVRFRDAATGMMVERSWTIRYDPQVARFDRASPSLQLAGIAALVAEKLGRTPLASQFKLGDFAAVVNSIRTHYRDEPQVQDLVTMFGRLRRIDRE